MARIYKRGKTYYSDIFFPSHPRAGKDGRVRVPLDSDKDFAQRKLAALLADRESARHGRPLASSDWPGFKTRIVSYLQRLDHHTRLSYFRAMRLLEETAPFTDVKQITPSVLEDLYLRWRAAGRGLYVRNKDMKCLKKMMRKAEGWGLVQSQDWESVKLDPEPRGRLIFYEPEEVRRLLDATTGVWRTMVYLGARAGLRRGEMRHLHRDDLDFGRNLLHVDSKPKEQWFVKDYEGILADGREWILQEGGWRPTEGSMTGFFSRIVRRAKLRGSLHTLRHTFASHLAIAGRDLREIRDLMGHDSVKTVEIYAHLRPGAAADAIASLPPL